MILYGKFAFVSMEVAKQDQTRPRNISVLRGELVPDTAISSVEKFSAFPTGVFAFIVPFAYINHLVEIIIRSTTKL